jgi:ATP-dependent DNA ligase
VVNILPTIEGVVAKRSDGQYLPGQRDWVKVKRLRTIDCVVIGIACAGPAACRDGKLHHLGLARPPKGMLSPQFASVLAAAGPEESPIRSRWQHAAVPTWRRVPPTAVCEVAYTVLDGNRWLRHAARFVCWRPDGDESKILPVQRVLAPNCVGEPSIQSR